MTTITIKIAGEEQMPTDRERRERVPLLWDSNATLMNEIFWKYFDLDPSDRYMGSFPYPDKDTGQPCVSWVLSMSSHFTRNAIVCWLRMVIEEAGLQDISVVEEDEKPDSHYRSRWPATMRIVAMGPSITDTLVGELRVQEVLTILAARLTRISSGS